MRRIVSLLALCLAAAQAQAAETRTAPDGHVPPPATVAQLGWLAGIWTGEGIGGAPATEVYSPPGGGSLAGHFVQQDGEGGVAFFELLQIVEVDGSLVYRLKHFSDDLAGWEEKDDYVSFPLVAIEPNAAYFSGLTLRREGDALISAVLVRQSDGSIEEYVFRYRRADKASPSCPDASTTPAMNECFGNKLQAAEAQMQRYVLAARGRYMENGEEGVSLGIENAQRAFEAYRDIECGTTHFRWRDGTIRGLMGLNCSIALTDQRTHAIWATWLTYPDGAPSTLPEPVPTP